MFKKAGTVTVAVAAGLLAAAPFASAGESHGHDHDGDHHKKKHGHESSDCNVVGGEAEANGGIEGDAVLGNVLAQLPVGGNNVGNIVCNDILNDNVSDNDVSISVLGSAVS
ncbi:hypothetical protein [Actinomycetospora cinnamomea]|uniref:Small secreted domain DUF320 n=1 Tax=Actinomycetospora cinnamomea TaxID=663609 RepID=A0A2U1F6E6_9PSEU|nr:hypothetical protein [Actinomycetospora cinnamomea]PVZ07767.1 hypothetical protein C8D89_111138 [Actinomycetospora cinnamomea]